MTSSPIINPEANSSLTRLPNRKTRRGKIQANSNSSSSSRLNQADGNTSDPTRWRSESEHRIYTSKLIDALSRVQPSTSSPSTGGRTVRETADRVLAVAAKGKTRWSRAILTGRLSLRLSQINKKHKHKKPKATGDNRLKKTGAKKRLPALQRKVRVLSRLVPGCRKVSFPNLLEEATDYVAALQMQVRAMTMLSALLSPGGSGGGDQP